MLQPDAAHEQDHVVFSKVLHAKGDGRNHIKASGRVGACLRFVKKAWSKLLKSDILIIVNRLISRRYADYNFEDYSEE